MLRALARNVSFYNCYESLQLRRTAAADRPLVDADGGATVSNVSFTPNRVEFAVIAGREPARVHFNQNFARGWVTTAGTLTPAGGQGMEVALEPGQAGHYAFTFTPPGLYAGLALALLSLVAVTLGRRLQLPDR